MQFLFLPIFFVFVIVSKTFQHELKRIIYKIIGRELNPIRQEENAVNTILLPAWLSNKSFYQVGLSKSKKRIKLK